MAELVAGAFLSSFLQVAFERLASRDFLDYFRHRKLDYGLLKKLRVTLLSVDKIVEDAEERQYRDHRVKKWLDEIKDEVFTAQDVLDDIATEASRQKLKAESQNDIMGKVQGFFTPLVIGNKSDKEMESVIKQVISNLEYLVKQNEILGLREGPSAGIQLGVNRNVCERVPTTLLIDKSNTYGRDDDKRMIVDKMLSQNMEGNQLPADVVAIHGMGGMDVIAIHGMGGMGKSTLAHLVYDDKSIKDQFQHRAWVCVSEEFDVDRVTTAILHSLNCPTELRDLHSRQLRLKEILMGKKLFLVLDDVWNENRAIWEAFQAPLQYAAPQSKILITTRNRTVADVMCCAFTHSLKPLKDGDSWDLFKKHAFKSQSDEEVDQELTKIGGEIVIKCGGLPLAIKTLGSLLNRRLSIQYWEKILKSDIWQLSENDSNIIPSLRLSYHYLPSNIKRCFAYCSIFAKDFNIDKNVLIQLWMADGLICPTQKGMSLEEAGDEIFNDLRARSFFEPSRRGGDYFIMHDLINDLAKSVAGEFFVRLEVGQAQDEDMPSKARYFSHVRNQNEYLETFEKVFKCHQLRSFLLFWLPWYRSPMDCDIMSRLSHLKYIRELSLTGGGFRIIPDGIGNLKHLHYLDLSWTSIKELPNSMCLLMNLQTLKLNVCLKLTKLPSNFCKLINLRHLELEYCGIKKMPKHLGKLSQLRTMDLFVVAGEGGSNIKELGALEHLTGSLTIDHVEHINDAKDVRDANLKEKQLDRLWLKYAVCNCSREEAQQQEQVLEALEPNHNVKTLGVDGYEGTKFPNWDMLPSLHHLKLRNCLAMEWFPRGGMLSNLQRLEIVSCSKVIASCRDWGLHELLSLKKLTICDNDMESFPEEGLWPPNLQSLTFQICNKLRRINHRGLVHLHSLTFLYFECCPHMSFEGMPEDGLPSSLSYLTIADGCPLLKERCEKEKGPDWPKIAHIPHVLFW